VLNDRHHLDLTHIHKQLIELLLTLTIKNQVCPEHKNASSHNRQNLQTLEPEDSVEEQEELVDFERATEGEHNPMEGSL